jgi:hypothetical protein
MSEDSRALDGLATLGPMSTQQFADRLAVSRDVLLVLAHAELVEQVLAYDGREYWYLVRPKLKTAAR